MQVRHTVLQTAGVDLTGSLPRIDVARTLLFICAPGTISTAMTAAIASEFPWLSVKTIPDLRSLPMELDTSVQLVLADVAFASELCQDWPKFAALHRNAGLALIGNDEEWIAGERQGQDAEMIQGIVPFNVNLDVFLSVLRIILKGGRYFSSMNCRPQSGARFQQKDEGELEIQHRLQRTSSPRGIEKLTKREREILARVAMGNQNKIIAAALGLSEHTVKIHIHNIITKLGVHNRTEVVALYFEHRRKDNSGNATDPNRRQDGAKLSDNE